MKFYESKTAKFLAGKGFYIVLAVCMAVIGVAAYSAIDVTAPKNNQPNVIEEQSNIVIPSIPIENTNSQENPLINNYQNSSIFAEADAQTDVPYYVQPISGSVAKGFSSTALQYSATFKDMRIHLGVDIEPSNGTTVNAAFSGTVIDLEENTVYGTVVTIDHGDGVVLKYCGLKNLTVQKGDIVASEEIIGEIGVVANECADKEHLHLELIKDGEYADPMSLFITE